MFCSLQSQTHVTLHESWSFISEAWQSFGDPDDKCKKNTHQWEEKNLSHSTLRGRRRPFYLLFLECAGGTLWWMRIEVDCQLHGSEAAKSKVGDEVQWKKKKKNSYWWGSYAVMAYNINRIKCITFQDFSSCIMHRIKFPKECTFLWTSK